MTVNHLLIGMGIIGVGLSIVGTSWRSAQIQTVGLGMAITVFGMAYPVLRLWERRGSLGTVIWWAVAVVIALVAIAIFLPAMG